MNALGNKWRLVLTVALVVVIADRVTKEITRHLLEGEQHAIRVWRGVLYVHWTSNDAGFLDAFEDLGRSAAWLFLAGSVLFAALIVHLLRLSSRPAEVQALSLVLAGVTGNALDRALYGHVIDCALLVVPTRVAFNIADLAILVGIVWAIVAMLRLPRRQEPVSS